MAKKRGGGRAQGTGCARRDIPGKAFFQEHGPISTGKIHPFGHPSWQGSKVCSWWGFNQAVPCRAAIHIFAPLIEDAIKLLPPPFLCPCKLPCPQGYFSPMGLYRPHADAFTVPLLSSSPSSIIFPCSWALQCLSKPEPLDFGLVIYLLALDALKSGGNSCLSGVLLAKPYSTS